ncbi:MAG: efflux RND transporter permease subunit [Candidatus Endonucleobacter bathymodioli]|uniref:Efflux RND transporter permease subunit n=1 Tax=Candidatus Endonucleibacter bathymodioli TaxID=539814 RepID=A0AA90NM61_9GAMM|nr:efflux RND transporter permease subunit [Candidatus Endonucleobacter bathymodioli]
MIRYFCAHPTAANLLMMVFLALGLITLPQINRETFPNVEAYSVQIQVPYPGATSLDVEQGICLTLENALDGISFVEEKVCQARQNMGVMTVKMFEQGDFAKFLDDVNSAVNSISDFPNEAELATVIEVGRIQNVISVALTADLPRAELKTLAEQIKQRLLRHKNIPIVEIQGFSDRQMLISVSDYNIKRYGLSLQDIADIVGKQNVDLPVGTIETHFQEAQLRISDERKSVSDLANIVVLSGENGNDVLLGDIATIADTFELSEDKISFNGKEAAILRISKNTTDDSLNVLDAVKEMLIKEQALLPNGVNLALTQDATSIVKDRIRLLSSNAWQGLILVFAVMWLFFTFRYSFWVVMGLPVSFLVSLYLLYLFGISINMFSMVALLLSLGILMDDAIVISESIGSQIKKGLSPLDASVEGTKLVARGVISSFLTTACIFTGLIFIEGTLGQVLKVIPIVLLSVISVSLIEAFLILPHHLNHSLAKVKKVESSRFRLVFERGFDALTVKISCFVQILIQYRYAFLGSVIAVFLISISMLASGILKFSAFPNIEGDMVQARILMPAGTSLKQTEAVVDKLLESLGQVSEIFQENEKQKLIKTIIVAYNENEDAYESGPHLATIKVDLLTSGIRNTRTQTFIDLWREKTGIIAQSHAISFKEAVLGPSGKPIEIRLKGDDFELLSQASLELQSWLRGYSGVENIFDDLRPGKPELSITLKDGAYYLGIDAQMIASQVRSAFQGVKVSETNVGLNTFEVTVRLDKDSRNEFADFDSFSIVHPKTKAIIPLSSIVNIEASRGYASISRVNNQRTITVYGDLDINKNNTKKVLADITKNWLPYFNKTYPTLSLTFEGEIKNAGTTQLSMMRAFLMGIFGVFILLSFQFRSYVEPFVVLVAIPLAMIGVVWGHLLMGLQFTMPSMMGFISLAGIVVNDSILLVEFVKKWVKTGLSVHQAAVKASHDRFRAVLLTSITTIAGMTPLLFETSTQAQILIPLVTSIVFGIATSTLLVLFVIPCLYCVLEDFGLAKAKH